MTRLGLAFVAAMAVAAAAGPFDIPLFNTPKAPDAKGQARLVFASSPFGVAVTADGRASYDVQIEARVSRRRLRSAHTAPMSRGR